MQNLYVLHQRHNKQGEKSIFIAHKKRQNLSYFFYNWHFYEQKIADKNLRFSAQKQKQ